MDNYVPTDEDVEAIDHAIYTLEPIDGDYLFRASTICPDCDACVTYAKWNDPHEVNFVGRVRHGLCRVLGDHLWNACPAGWHVQ